MEADAVAYDEVAVEADHEEAYVQDDDPPSYQEDRAALDPDPDPDPDLGQDQDQVHLHDADASYVVASVHHAYVVVLHVVACHEVAVVQEIHEVQVVRVVLVDQVDHPSYPDVQVVVDVEDAVVVVVVDEAEVTMPTKVASSFVDVDVKMSA